MLPTSRADGDEKEGLDETIVPVDYQRAGQIHDDVSTSFTDENTMSSTLELVRHSRTSTPSWFTHSLKAPV